MSVLLLNPVNSEKGKVAARKRIEKESENGQVPRIKSYTSQEKNYTQGMVRDRHTL